MPKIIYTNKELLVTVFVIAACLLLSSFFPAQGLIQNLAGLFSFLVLIPLLYIKMILKKNLRNFGFQVGDWRKGLAGFLIASAFAGLSLYILINYSDLLQKQKALGALKGNFGNFLYYETAFSASMLIIFELFLRGFVLFGMEGKFGSWAIPFQFSLSLLLVWIIGLFPMGISYYIIIGSLFSGIIAYRSRSLIYGIVFQWLFVLISDAVVIRLLK